MSHRGHAAVLLAPLHSCKESGLSLVKPVVRLSPLSCMAVGRAAWRPGRHTSHAEDTYEDVCGASTGTCRRPQRLTPLRASASKASEPSRTRTGARCCEVCPMRSPPDGTSAPARLRRLRIWSRPAATGPHAVAGRPRPRVCSAVRRTGVGLRGVVGPPQRIRLLGWGVDRAGGRGGS